MFKAISKSNLWIIARNTTLAVAVVLGLSQGAKADDTKIYETLQVSCNPFAKSNVDAQCSSNLDIKPEAEQIAQRRGRRRKSRVEGYYAGLGLGIFFTSDVDEVEADNAFGGSIFGGIKFNKYFAADLEFLGAFGDFDLGDDLDDEDIEADYSGIGFYINPRAELPIFEIGGSTANLYISPGIGLSISNITINVSEEAAEELDISEETDASNTGISFQVKGGISVPISNSINIFGQLRYATLPTDDDVDDSLNFFSTEAGVSFRF